LLIRVFMSTHSLSMAHCQLSVQTLTIRAYIFIHSPEILSTSTNTLNGKLPTAHYKLECTYVDDTSNCFQSILGDTVDKYQRSQWHTIESTVRLLPI
jgi:hypothetical protein